MADELGLKLSAQVSDWVTSLAKAADSADKLLKTVLELERSVKAAFQGIEAAARQGAGKAAGAFVASARVIDEATGKIEEDAKSTAKALGGVAVAADKTAKSVAKSAGELGKASGGVARGAAAAASNTTSALAGVNSSFGKISGRLRDGIFSIQSALLGLGAVRFGQEAVSAASEFEAAIGQVNIVAADSGKSIEELRGFLLDLSKTTPVGLVDLTKSLGDAIGKLPKGANQAATAIDALNAAQSAARASGSSAGQVLDGIIPILNTYGKTGITAAEITDKLFATFDQGGATVPELSASLGQIVGISSQFGISINELLGEIAVLTRGGQTASEAITNLRQAFVSTARPPENVQKILKSLNIEFGTAALKSKGLIGVLKDIEDKGGTSQIEKLFTDTQGFLGVSTLLGAGLGQVREDIDLIGQASGKTDAAVGKIAQNFDQLAGIAKNRLGAAMIEIGERIMPTVVRVLGQLADYAEKNGTQIADGIGKAVETLADFGTWVVENGQSILAWFLAFKGVSFLSGLVDDISKAITGLEGFAKAAKETQDGMGEAGEGAGDKFSGGVLGKLKGLSGKMQAILSAGSFVGVILGVGFQLGSALIDGISEIVTRDLDKLAGEIKTRTDELGDQIADKLRQIGFSSIEEMDRALASGTKVIVEGSATTLTSAAAKGVDALENAAAAGFSALDKLQLRAADKLNEARLGLEDTRTALEALEAQVQTKLAAAGSGPGSDIAAVAIARGAEPAILAAQAKQAEAQGVLNSVTKNANDLAEGRNKLQAEYNQLLKPSATPGGPSVTKPARSGTATASAAATSELEDLAKEVIASYERLEELRLRAIQSGAESAQNEVDARRAAFESETDARIDALAVVDGAEKKSAEYRAERERAATSIIDDQIKAMQRAADARIEEARSAAAAETKAFAESADIQLQIAEQLARDEAQIQADVAARTEEIKRSSIERIAAADRAAGQARLEEAIRNAQRAAEVEQNSSLAGRAGSLVAGLSDPVAGGQMAEGIGNQIAEAAGPGVLGELAQQGGAVVGTIAGIAVAIAKLPDILNGIAEFLTTGIDDFVSSLFESLLGVLMALATELGPQLIKVLTETIPAFVEALIAALPQIIGGLIILLPQIAFALVKAIVYSLPIAIVKGVIQAGEKIFEFITSGLVTRIGEGIYDAFASAGEFIIEGLKTAFRWIVDIIKELLDGAGDFAGGLFGQGGEGFGAFAGRTLGTSLVGKLATGKFSDIDERDIPIVGGAIGFVEDLFHQGGMVNSPSSPHAAAAMAMAGAPRFASGGMVAPIANLARRRLAQVLGGDDVPALLAPGEGVLTARGVEAAGGPAGVESMNRGNRNGGGGLAQITLSTRVGGDAALAALLTRVISVSVRSPSGNVRMAMDQAQRATRVPAFQPVR